jgi:hypothetical protein
VTKRAGVVPTSLVKTRDEVCGLVPARREERVDPAPHLVDARSA